MPTDGNALWKVAKDSSMMWRREALDVAPQQPPAKSLTMASLVHVVTAASLAQKVWRVAATQGLSGLMEESFCKWSISLAKSSQVLVLLGKSPLQMVYWAMALPQVEQKLEPSLGVFVTCRRYTLPKHCMEVYLHICNSLY